MVSSPQYSGGRRAQRDRDTCTVARRNAIVGKRTASLLCRACLPASQPGCQPSCKHRRFAQDATLYFAVNAAIVRKTLLAIAFAAASAKVRESDVASSRVRGMSSRGGGLVTSLFLQRAREMLWAPPALLGTMGRCVPL